MAIDFFKNHNFDEKWKNFWIYLLYCSFHIDPKPSSQVKCEYFYATQEKCTFFSKKAFKCDGAAGPPEPAYSTCGSSPTPTPTPTSTTTPTPAPMVLKENSEQT